MYGLLGRTLSHSLSPQIHKFFGSYTYELFCREPYELSSFFEDRSIDGFNVTIPYKIDAYNACDILSPTAVRTGSVNTVIRLKDGSLSGYNTDYFGFQYMVKKSNTDFKNKKVIILGSGGVSLTVKTFAEDMGACDVIRISRNGKDNYKNLSRHYDAQIIINAAPVGMYPNNGEKLINLYDFKNAEAVFDLIYNPFKTELILEAEKLGIKSAGGLSMLAAQGLRSSEIFTEKKLDEKLISEVQNNILSQLKNIVLIGMPGCGKSTIAGLLSAKLHRELIDTDEEIRKSEGLEIPEIFSLKGENCFREKETFAVKEAGKKTGKIIAVGGGAVLKEENRHALKQNGTIIYIKRDISSLATDGRPLSKDETSLKKLYDERKVIYESLADITVEADENPDITAEKVIRCVF